MSLNVFRLFLNYASQRLSSHVHPKKRFQEIEKQQKSSVCRELAVAI